MKFRPDRLIQLRTSMNISKAEAARQLNISAMTYGRYEKGEREPLRAGIRTAAERTIRYLTMQGRRNRRLRLFSYQFFL